jgi:hypothetical protein
MHILRLDTTPWTTGTADWTDMGWFDSSYYGPAGKRALTLPPAMGFRPFRPGPPDGRLYVWYEGPPIRPGLAARNAVLVNYLVPNPGGGWIVLPDREETVGGQEDPGPEGMGLSLYLDERGPDAPSLRGVRHQRCQKEDVCGAGLQLTVWPYADGIMDWDMSDQSDFVLLKTLIPLSLDP